MAHNREQLTVLRFVFLRLGHYLRFPWSSGFNGGTPRLQLETFEFSPWETLKSDELRWYLVFVIAERLPTFKMQRKQQKSGENKSHSSRLPRFPEHAQETRFLIWRGTPYLDGCLNGIPVLFSVRFSVLFSSVWSRSFFD